MLGDGLAAWPERDQREVVGRLGSPPLDDVDHRVEALRHLDGVGGALLLVGGQARRRRPVGPRMLGHAHDASSPSPSRVLAEPLVASGRAARSTSDMTANGGRRSVVKDVAEAVAGIEDGATVGLGGAVTAGHPMALVRALARRAARDLTVVAPVGGIEVDLLVAAGCVKKVVGSYVGVERLSAVGPVSRRAMDERRAGMMALDGARCVIRLRAAGHRLPLMRWRGGVLTSFPYLISSLVE